MRGTLHLDFYDKNGRMVFDKTLETENSAVEYRIEIPGNDMDTISSVNIYITNTNANAGSTVTEMLSVQNGDFPELPSESSDIETKYNDGHITFHGNTDISGATLIKAVYNGDILESAEMYTVESNDDSINVGNDDGKVKFMLWKSFRTCKPLAEALPMGE